MKALPFICSVSLKLYIFFNTYLICDNYSVHKVVKQLENYLEEIFMSKLLRELTDKEIQTSLSNGGSTCSMYKALLPGHIAACAASAYFYGLDQSQ